MTHKRKIEDYVRTIHALQAKGGVRGVHIARALKVSKPTVSVTLKALEREGFLRIGEDHMIVLTERGARIAEDVTTRNKTFYDLLTSLGVDEDTATADACRLEHAISQKSFLALLSLAESRPKTTGAAAPAE